MQRLTVFQLLLLFCGNVPLCAQAVLETIAGGPFQVSGLGGPAKNVAMGPVSGLAFNDSGELIVVVQYGYVYKLTAQGNLQSAVPGQKLPQPQTSALLPSKVPIAVDRSGNILLAYSRIDPSGSVTPFVDLASSINLGDGGPATNASVRSINGLAVDSKGNIYLADAIDNRVRKIDTNGIISTFAGNGKCCFSGDGVAANQTALNGPRAVAVDARDNVYIADTYNERIRRVGTDGIIVTVAGGVAQGFSGDGGPALLADFDWPTDLAIEPNGAIDILDSNNQRVRQVTAGGMIRTIAGTGAKAFSGDGGPGAAAALNSPQSIAADSLGNLFIADTGNGRVRKLDSSGTLTTVAGTGEYGDLGDGGPARQVYIQPNKPVIDSGGTVYFSDRARNRIRKISPEGIISTLAGGYLTGSSGDGGPVASALLNNPGDLAFDSNGALYIVDGQGLRIRKITPDGTIHFVANANVPYSIGSMVIDRSDRIFFTENAPSFGSRLLSFLPGDPASKILWQDSGFTNFLGPLSIDAAGYLWAPLTNTRYVGPPIASPLLRFLPDGSQQSTAASFLCCATTLVFDGKGGWYQGNRQSISHWDSTGSSSDVPGTQTLNNPFGLTPDAFGNIYFIDNNSQIRKLLLNPITGLLEPSLQLTLQPGFYILAVTLGAGERAGTWGLQASAAGDVFSGGLDFGGTLAERSAQPGFAGFYLTSPRSVSLHGSTQGQISVQILDSSLQPVEQERSGTGTVDLTESLNGGFYIVMARGVAGALPQGFQLSLSAPFLSDGVIGGGWLDKGTVGYLAFDLSAPAAVNLLATGQPSYGEKGSGAVRLTLYDSTGKVVAAAPQ